MNIEKALVSPGDRLRRARMLAGLNTRREFENKHHISANTLQGWEQGKNPLSEKGARRVVEAFKDEGLICTTQWLLSGKGMPPRPYEMLKTGMRVNGSDPNEVNKLNLNEEECIYKETQLFKELYPSAIVISITDDAMAPYFKEGDYVGGVQVPNEALTHYHNALCILELENNLILPRMLQPGTQDNRYTASCTNPNTRISPLNIYDAKVICAAPIVWHRRKLSSF